MDDANLAQLREALVASPDNVALLCVLLRAYLERNEPAAAFALLKDRTCLLYTSPSPRDVEESRMPSSA